MPEPITHSAGGAALALAPAAATAGIFGIDPASIGWAFVGGTLALIWLERFNDWRMAMGSIIGSTILGSALAQWTAEPVLLTVAHFADWLKPWATTAAAEKTAMWTLALGIGLFTQKAMPGIFRRVGILSEGNHDRTD